MFLETHRGRVVSKEAVKRFREAAQRLSQVSAFKGRQKVAYADLLDCAHNLCDGTTDGLRLFVDIVILRVFGNVGGELPRREARRVVAALSEKRVEHDGEDLTCVSLRNAPERARKKLLNRVLRELDVAPPRSGARREDSLARKA
jgi:hypothetical protein